MGASYGREESSQNVVSPKVKNVPKFSDSINEFIDAFPQLLSGFGQYAPQVANIQQGIETQIAPQTSALEESIAGQVNQALAAPLLPESMKNELLDIFRAQAGVNAVSPIGADFITRNLLNESINFKNNAVNQGLSLLSRRTPVQPLPFFDFQPSLPANFNTNTFQTRVAGERPFTTTHSSGFNTSFNLPLSSPEGA